MRLNLSSLIGPHLQQEILRDLSALGGTVVLGVLILGNMIANFYHGFGLAIGMVIVMGAGYFIKALFRPQRPDHLERPAGSGMFDQLDASSFPSIHAARISAFVIMILFPTSPLAMKIFWISIALAVMASRVLLRRHRVADVLAGGVLGVVVGFFLSQYY